MEPGPLEEMSGSKTKEGNTHTEPGEPVVLESKEVLKTKKNNNIEKERQKPLKKTHYHNDRGMSKRCRNQLRQLPIAQNETIWASK